MTGPKSLTAKRLISRGLTQDHRKLWATLGEKYGFRLNANVKKHRHSPGFVLEAVRGKGKTKTRFQSCKLKLVFKSETEARNLESGVKFGDSLLSMLEVKRKRYRGTIECDVDNTFHSNAVPKKKLRFVPVRQVKGDTESFAKLLCRRAAKNGIEQTVFAATKGYTDFTCIGKNLRKKGAVSNFLRKLKTLKLKAEKREQAEQLYRQHAQHLREGLAAGTLRNFVCHRDDDGEDDVASWRRQHASTQPLRSDFSAYDLFRVQKQMLGLAIYYEAMLTTGNKKTDRFDTQEDALIFAGEAVQVSSRTIRRWRDDYLCNNRRFTERYVCVRSNCVMCNCVL